MQEASKEEIENNYAEMMRAYDTINMARFADMCAVWRGGATNAIEALVADVESGENAELITLTDGGAIAFEKSEPGRVWYFGQALEGKRGAHYYAEPYASELRQTFRLNG